jgi:hypothetical protein
MKSEINSLKLNILKIKNLLYLKFCCYLKIFIKIYVYYLPIKNLVI